MSVVIDNPILNSPFKEPTKHFRFSDEGITNDVVEERRRSSYFVPIPRPRSSRAQKMFETEWTQERIEENQLINRIQERLGNMTTSAINYYESNALKIQTA